MRGNRTIALEVKSANKQSYLSGMNKFIEKYRPDKTYVIAENDLRLQDFLKLSISELF